MIILGSLLSSLVVGCDNNPNLSGGRNPFGQNYGEDYEPSDAVVVNPPATPQGDQLQTDFYTLGMAFGSHQTRAYSQQLGEKQEDVLIDLGDIPSGSDQSGSDGAYKGLPGSQPQSAPGLNPMGTGSSSLIPRIKYTFKRGGYLSGCISQNTDFYHATKIMLGKKVMYDLHVAHYHKNGKQCMGLYQSASPKMSSCWCDDDMQPPSQAETKNYCEQQEAILYTGPSYSTYSNGKVALYSDDYGYVDTSFNERKMQYLVYTFMAVASAAVVYVATEAMAVAPLCAVAL
jgi:hypothetical protein